MAEAKNKFPLKQRLIGGFGGFFLLLIIIKSYISVCLVLLLSMILAYREFLTMYENTLSRFDKL